MPSTLAVKSYSLQKLHDKILSGEAIVMELAINASTYMQPDKYFLLKASDKIQDFIILIQLLEIESLQKCEMAYFDEESDELLGEFSIKEFVEFYNLRLEG